jgi:tRNA(fMet)-specific endonuclease VapC
MAGPVAVDTDLVIDFLRGKGPEAAFVRDLILSHRLRVTAITAFELRVGGAGHDIGLADCLQAGICLKFDLPLRYPKRQALQSGGGSALG